VSRWIVGCLPVSTSNSSNQLNFSQSNWALMRDQCDDHPEVASWADARITHKGWSVDGKRFHTPHTLTGNVSVEDDVVVTGAPVELLMFGHWSPQSKGWMCAITVRRVPGSDRRIRLVVMRNQRYP
jgi:hypothetical protein